MHLKFVVSGRIGPRKRETRTKHGADGSSERKGRGFLTTFGVTAQRPKQFAILRGNPPQFAPAHQPVRVSTTALVSSSDVVRLQGSLPGLSSDCGRNLWQ